MLGETQRIPYEGRRVDTGPVQFGDDWPGVFIRGDEVSGILRVIQNLHTMRPEIRAVAVQDIADLLTSCVVS